MKKRSDVPDSPHYQVLVFGTTTEWTAPYDYHDPPTGTTSSVPSVDVYAFKERDDMERFIEAALERSVEIAFFRVGSSGRVTKRVILDIDGLNEHGE